MPERLKPQSRGYETDLMLAALEGSVVYRDGYVVAQTPSCPAFWWGNFVLFPGPPRLGQERDWEDVFDREFAGVGGIKHRQFAWDGGEAEATALAGFIERGYSLDESIFLVARGVQRSTRHRTDVQVRPIQGAQEWRRALHIQHASLDPDRDTPSFRRFQAAQMARNQRLVDRGCGQWFGAFEGESCVATLGVFVQEGLARCQSVATLPSHRRRGYCSTLVHDACDFAFRQMAAREIVIMTNAGNPAGRVYQAVGFGAEERVQSLSLSRGTGARAPRR